MLTQWTCFNTQPPEGGCVISHAPASPVHCFNTQPPEGGCEHRHRHELINIGVSTHSRPKAAADIASPSIPADHRFNTQPPEGGCKEIDRSLHAGYTFQHTAARRRLPQADVAGRVTVLVSTHSRPKAAAGGGRAVADILPVSTHSRPKAAASTGGVSFAASAFQHTAARRRLQKQHLRHYCKPL